MGEDICKEYETACKDIPVGDVSASDHGGYIGDRVACHTGLVEPWVLANQMTGQETTMGAPTKCQLLRVQFFIFQDTFNSKLAGRKHGESVFLVNKHTYINIFSTTHQST